MGEKESEEGHIYYTRIGLLYVCIDIAFIAKLC